MVSRQDHAEGGRPGDAPATDVSISSSARLVAFATDATNLSQADVDPDPGNPLEGFGDVFVRDRRKQATRLISPAGARAHSYDPSLAPDGSAVVFVSARRSQQYGDVWVRNLRDGKLKRVGRRSTALGFQRPAANPVISNRGRVAVYASSGRTAGVHVANTRANRRTTLFRRRQSFQGGLSVSGNGRVAAWTTVGTSGDRVSVSVYRSSTSAHKRRLVARFRAQCCLSESRVYGTSLSANGDRLAYTALRKGRYYVLVYSARTGRSRVLGRGMYPSMSADGGRVAYSRASTTMYVRRVTGNRLLSRVRHALTGALSPDGHWLAYVASGSRQQAFVRRIK